ncbi:MAG: TatD family hydrolase [Lentisphaeria bacterium]|nr:TatD family hydrolase [Lentisphaeria bacterium]
MFCDFHTHCSDVPAGQAALISSAVPPGSAAEGAYYSLELHPWTLPDSFHGLPEVWADQLSRVCAVGEIGLDKCRGPALPVQMAFLRAALHEAQCRDLPVVIHCVRAFPELQMVLREFRISRLLFHGFRGSPEFLQQVRRAGFFTSSARGLPEDLLDCGLETDDGDTTLSGLYRSFAADPEKEKRLEENFRRFLKL